MKSMSPVLFAVILLFSSDLAQAQGFRGGFGGGSRGGFTAATPSGTSRGGFTSAPPSGTPAGRPSQTPGRSAAPQFQRSNQPPAHTQFRAAPGRTGVHHKPPSFVPHGGAKFVHPSVPFVSPRFRHSHFFPHRHGFVVFGVPQFWGSTVVTQVAPGVLQAERRYLPDSSPDARVREPGQLAPFDPTPPEVVDRMLALAGVTKDDVIYDLGSGDGRVLIAAARKYGARGVGFEIDAGLVKLARENARREGVEKLVEIRQEDFRSADLSAASVVTLYLSYDGNLAVREQLQRQLRPGARVVSYTFDMGDWPPKIAESYRDAAGDEHALYLWEITEAPVVRKGAEPMLQPYPTRSSGPLIIEVR